MLGCGSMDQKTIDEFREKHFENYKNAVIETLKNNTVSLFEDDIKSLLQKPPLDSMDVIRCKFLDLAKRHKTIIQAEALDQILDVYRKSVVKYIPGWKKMRIDELSKIVHSFSPKRENDVIRFNKKDFQLLDRKLKKQMKENIIEVIEKKIVNNVNQLFTDSIDDKIKKTFSDEMIKYVRSAYVKQLLENVDFKIIVKDTTLMNGVREQGERFLFTKRNSYLLNENKSSNQEG